MSDSMRQRAKELRRNMSVPERVLWKRLRGRHFAGWKFKRQVPLGPFVADFLCAQAKLVVEIDGSTHDRQGERDRARDTWMRERGLRVMRISASDLSKNERAVLERILHELRKSPSASPTSPPEVGEVG
ncbi:MAG: DUF559 domain-containing protein [Phycisphaerales bacterium]